MKTILTLCYHGFAIRGTWLLVAIATLGLSACNLSSRNPSPAQNGQPRVVATSTILADLTQQVGAGEIQLQGILQPGADPHVYEPVPADSRTLAEADLIFYNGYNLEPGLIKLMNATAEGAAKVAVAEVIPPLQLAHTSGPTTPDPHVWGDVQNVIRMVNLIRDRLIDLAPEDRTTLSQNAAQLVAELNRLDTWIRQQIQTIPPERRRLVTTHDAFQYYGRAYSLQIIGTLIGISTEEQPSARTTRQLVETIKEARVPAIFAETTINPTLIRTVAQEAGVQLSPNPLYSDSIGAPGSEGDTYIRMMVANTKAIVTALGGRYTPFAEVPEPTATP